MDEKTPSSQNQARILIVDDHPNTASMLARVLKKLDTPADVLVASSGEEALGLASNAIFDVLITDFIMPGMSGLELIEKLKKQECEPGHIILITAYDIPGLTMTARQLKIQDFLVKPVDPEKIRAIVTRVLKQIRPAQGPGEQKSITSHTPRILIADDNPDNIRLLAVRLQSEGYQFITAADGEETLKQVRSEKPDLVLLDVNMPNKDGFEVLQEMRSDAEMAHIPVIIVTAARIGVKDVREGLTLGADDYITKPFDWRELSARIRNKLRVKQAEDALRSKNKELGVLPEISLDLGERLDVEALTRSILARTVAALKATNGYLVVFHPDGMTSLQVHDVQDMARWGREEERNRVTSEGAVAKVIATRQSLLISDTETSEDWVHVPTAGAWSALLTPLLGRRDVLGVLALLHEQVNYFSADQQALLQAIASQAAVAIENAQLYAAERKRVNELVALNQLTHEISQFTRSAELWERLTDLVWNKLGYPAVGIWMFDGGKLTLRSLSGAENAPRHSILELAPQQASATGQPVQLSGPIEERTGERMAAGRPPVQSVIAVPLFWEMKLKGVLSIHSQKAGAFQESDRVILETLAGNISSAFERVQLFESVEQEQRRLAAVLRSAADAILVLDAQGRLMLVNPAGERLFTDVQARVGQALPAGKGYDDLIAYLDDTRRAAQPGASEVPWPDNRTFSLMVTPVEDGGQVAILHDVSHFKALDHIKNEFLATASHDLKNPIFAVLGYSDLLSRAGQLNDMQADFVGRIRNAAVQMQDLVLNLLEIARMEMDIEPKVEKFDLNEMLGAVIEEFRPQADGKHQTVAVELCAGPLWVQGDRLRLQQVGRNLLGNAIKYTPQEGRITILSEAAQGQAQVKFQDTGIGIPAEEIPHLFEKFYRVRNKDTQDIEGNGLGLAIVKSIVEQHGGTVKVESNVGVGSCFSFQIPGFDIASIR